MLSSVPSDIFSGVTEETPVETADDASEADADADAGAETFDDGEPPAIGDEPEESEAVAEPEEEEAPVEAKPEDKPAEEEELPEGVRKGKDRKGKDGYFLEENRYKTFHGNHQLVQKGAEILGEPLTPEALKLRNDAYLGQERLFTNLTSGDPASQSDVLKFIVDEMKGAQESGEVGVDPTVPFAESVYQTLKEAAPDAYAKLRLQAARDLVEEIWSEAAVSGNKDLFYSNQHLLAMLTGTGPIRPNESPDAYARRLNANAERQGYSFHLDTEIEDLARNAAAPSDNERLARENAELKAQLNGRTQQGTAAQFDTWQRSSVQTVNTAVMTEAVQPALAAVEGSWKKFPDDYKRLVVDPLNREVNAEVKGDPALNQRVLQLTEQAKRATSEQVRHQIGQTIKQLYVNRAKLAVEKVKGPILKFAAESLKGRSDQAHERRNGAQTRTAPKGASAPVKRSIVPDNTGFKNGVYDSATAMKQMLAVLGGR